MRIERQFEKRGPLYVPRYAAPIYRGPRWCPYRPGQKGHPGFKFGSGLTVTAAATGYDSAGSYSAPSTSAPYNQQAGNCIVIFISVYPYSVGAPLLGDSAGNSFDGILWQAGYNYWGLGTYVVQNCLGNSSNTVEVTYGPCNYWSIMYYDVAGVLTSGTFYDVNGYAATDTSGSPISETISTAYANQAILTYLNDDDGLFNSVTTPSGFTLDVNSSGTGGSFAAASQVVSSLQSGLSVSWAYNANVPNPPVHMQVLSLIGAGGTNQLMLMGCGM